MLRRENVDRYDDRDIVDTNLIDGYERLFAFAQKHLPDKFFVEDSFRKSLRNIIVREMISNTLMHREFTSSFQAQFIIERSCMFVKNANRSPAQKIITPENLVPKPKNPTIASFFRNIGYADQLGSGVRKLFQYSKLYGGANPTFSEDDVFKITVSLNDYTGESQNKGVNNRVNNGVNNGVNNRVNNQLSEIQQKIINVLREKPTITQREMSKCVSVSLVHINKNMRVLQEMGAVSRNGNNKQGSWVVNEEMVNSL